jgi:hypothetical protein
LAALSVKGASHELSARRAISRMKTPNRWNLRKREVRCCAYSAVVGRTGEMGRPPTLRRVGSSTAIGEWLARVPLELCMKEWAGEEEAAERCLPPFVGRLAIAC